MTFMHSASQPKPSVTEQLHPNSSFTFRCEGRKREREQANTVPCKPTGWGGMTEFRKRLTGSNRGWMVYNAATIGFYIDVKKKGGDAMA